MSAIQMNKYNRKYIDRLKIRGVEWLKNNIAMEKRMSTAHEPNYALYIQAMEKALSEIESVETI